MAAPKYFDQLFRQDPKYFNHIEGLRALAALWIMLYHIAIFACFYLPQADYRELLNHPFFKIALSANVSLDVFFVISGVVIGHALIKEHRDHGKVDLYSFFVRRCSRVYPLYLLILAIGSTISIDSFHNIWTNILQINNFVPIAEQHLIWTWSLAVDFQFYVLFAIIIWLISKKYLGKHTCYAMTIGLLILPIIATTLLIDAHHAQHLSININNMTTKEFRSYYDMGFAKLYVRCGPFVYGVLTAYILVYHKNKLQQMLNSIGTSFINLLTVTLLALILLLLANDPIWFLNKADTAWQMNTQWFLQIQRNLFSLLLCALLLLADYPRGIVMMVILKILNSSVWRPLGQLTFTTYLIHPIVMIVGFIFFFAQHKIVLAGDYFQFGLCLVFLTYLISIPLYLLVEQPAMDYIKHKLLRSKHQKEKLASNTAPTQNETDLMISNGIDAS